MTITTEEYLKKLDKNGQHYSELSFNAIVSHIVSPGCTDT